MEAACFAHPASDRRGQAEKAPRLALRALFTLSRGAYETHQNLVRAFEFIALIL
jgi:hypothetical protein